MKTLKLNKFLFKKWITEKALNIEKQTSNFIFNLMFTIFIWFCLKRQNRLNIEFNLLKKSNNLYRLCQENFMMLQGCLWMLQSCVNVLLRMLKLDNKRHLQLCFKVTLGMLWGCSNDTLRVLPHSTYKLESPYSPLNTLIINFW